MAIITLYSASFCRGPEAAERIARRLGFRTLTDADLAGYASCDLTAAQLLRALTEPPPPRAALSDEKRRGLAYLREALATAMLEDGLVYHGYGAHLVDQPLPHLLRIGLAASRRFRLARALATQGWTTESGRIRLLEDDARGTWLTRHLHGLDPFDRSLYDLLLTKSNTELHRVVDIVATVARLPELRYEARAPQASHDFLIAARVGVSVAELGYDADVACSNGRVALHLRALSPMQSALCEDLRHRALQVAGVDAVTVDVRAPRARATDLALEAAEHGCEALVVSLDEALLQRLDTALRTRGFMPRRAAHEQAMTTAFVYEPGVVLLDLVAEAQPIELMRTLKREHPRCALIVLTPQASEREARQIAREGADAYLPRSAGEEVVLGAVESARWAKRGAPALARRRSEAGGDRTVGPI